LIWLRDVIGRLPTDCNRVYYVEKCVELVNEAARALEEISSRTKEDTGAPRENSHLRGSRK
jgi:hypothetical protein